jgi:CDP-glycerol glycerophosphotransferase
MRIIKFIILYTVSILIRPFIKIDKQLLLFSTQGGRSYDGNAKYLFLYCSKYSNYDCVWITKDKKIGKEINDSGFKSLYYFTWKALALSLKAYCVFITHSLSDVMPVFYNSQTIIINLWHAIPIKNVSFLDNNLSMKARILDFWRDKRCNYFISNSESFNQDYLKCFKINKEKIIVGGLPRIDFLFNPEKFVPNITNPFPSMKKVYLYAPTFRDYKYNNPFYKKDSLIKLNEYLEKSNSILYIKHHPFDIEIPKMESLNNISDFTKNIDIYEILPFVDSLICDYSSIVYDFFIAYPNRDIFLFCPDLEKYEQARGFLGPFQDLYNCGTEPYKFGFRRLIKTSNIFDINELYGVGTSSCKTIMKIIKHHD